MKIIQKIKNFLKEKNILMQNFNNELKAFLNKQNLQKIYKSKDFKIAAPFLIIFIFSLSFIIFSDAKIKFLTASITNISNYFSGSDSDYVIYPLKEVSTLDCRFNDFSSLSSNCKQSLPILNTKDYNKYVSLNDGYNEFTRYYTMLWWSSYKYGWDMWNWWHIWTDIVTAKWTPIYNIANWKVIKAKNDFSLWNYVSVEHFIRWKQVVSTYAHLSKIDAKEWEFIKVWTKIGEVWSTWNSTWNHLHIQIDLTAPFYPYYYDYKKCPYSYYDLVEEWVCFDELNKNTIDPLLFLETGWEILDKLTNTATYVKKEVINTSSNNNSNSNPSSSSNNSFDMSIFNRTVYIWYWESDIKKVQQIYTDLWYYSWNISWDYSDLEKFVIDYQVSRWVIQTRNESWAGWFWPKTRAQTKIDYLKYLENKDNKETQNTNTNETEQVVENIIVENKIEIQKIEKKNILTREEIEKIEVENFLKFHNVELYLVNKWWNILEWTKETLKLKVTDKKWNPFRWNIPWNMTFIVDNSKVSVFPTSLFYFDDGKRDIFLTWLNTWDTNLYIKIWNQTIKTIPLKVYSNQAIIYPESSVIISPKTSTLWERKTWVVAFKDDKWKYMINLPFWSTFNIKASDDNKICIKRWDIKDIQKIFKYSPCDEADYKNEFNFTYDDTISWILIYDFKAVSNNFKVEVKNNYNNLVLSEKKVAVTNPKWLDKNYAYTNEVVDMLKKWVVNWVDRWYFLENRELSQRDAFIWIENALIKMKNDTHDSNLIKKIDSNLSQINNVKPFTSKYSTITRKDFLDLNYKYLIFEKNSSLTLDYRDINTTTSEKIASIFDKNTTWKDQFWANYFRPDEKITRWEWAFFLSKTIEKVAHSYLTLK